jgi:ABC-type microcin C transport system duplicated ATPase subunit YejF
MKVGKQIGEGLQLHLGMSKEDARATALKLLQDVRIPSPDRRLDQYSFELSGGMRQRVMIALAMSCGPTLMFADEPTTALDVTVQAQILDLLDEQRRDRNMSLILVTHDLGVVAGRTDEIAGDVRRQARREGTDGFAVRQHEDAVHRSAVGEHPEAQRSQPHPPQGDSPDVRPISSTRRRAAGSRRVAGTPKSAVRSRSLR